MKRKKPGRVCVIGAGAAGIGASYFLRKKGYADITVLEKNDCVGGMCYSERVYGMANGMGAIAITPDYTNVIRLARKYGLDLTPGPVNVLLDYATGFQYRLKHIMGEGGRFRLFLSVARYYWYLLRYAGSVRKPGFRNTAGELARPFRTWLEERGMMNLADLFAIPITCFGYGHLDEIPALYAFKYMNFWNFTTLLYVGFADVLGFAPRWSKRLTNGLQDLIQIMADELPDVRTGIDIINIRRSPGDDNPVTVSFADRKTGKRETLEFDRLIIAMCPDVHNLGFLDLTAREKEIFSRIRHNNYYTIACEVKSLSYNYFLQLLENRKIKFPPDGYPCMVSKVWDECDVVIFYSYSRENLSEKEIVRRFRQNAKQINRDVVKILEVKKWDYFPHFGADGLEGDLYGTLEKMQGETCTYYTGGLLNFELVENVIAYSRYMAKKHF